MLDYYIYYVPFPRGSRSHGMVLLNPDGTASVYIDANATEEQQRSALRHELDHLTGDDLFGEKNIKKIEFGS